MKLIDTHSHLYLKEFDKDRNALILAAMDSGIDAVLLPNVDTSTVGSMHELCEAYPGFAYPMMGLHPTSIDARYINELKKTESLLSTRPYCAIGEIGIDLYWDKTYLKEQIQAFEEQLKWSIDLKLPVAIHTREAFPEVLESIHKIGKDKLTGVFHSFSGTISDLEEIKQLPGFKLGINGVVTFKNSGLADVIAQTSIHNIVLETDAPYLSPVPYRGKRNEPAYIWKTVEKVADVFNMPIEEIVDITRKNTLKLFKMTNKSL